MMRMIQRIDTEEPPSSSLSQCKRPRRPDGYGPELQGICRADTCDEGGTPVAKSSTRDKVEGAIDTAAGRILEAFSKLTGNRSAGAKGKAARGRGAGRSAKGRAKSRS